MFDIVERLRKQELSNNLPDDELCSGAADEIERLTSQLKATEANEQVLVDANKPLLERIAKLEASLETAKRCYVDNDPDGMFAALEKT